MDRKFVRSMLCHKSNQIQLINSSNGSSKNYTVSSLLSHTQQTQQQQHQLQEQQAILQNEFGKSRLKAGQTLPQVQPAQFHGVNNTPYTQLPYKTAINNNIRAKRKDLSNPVNASSSLINRPTTTVAEANNNKMLAVRNKNEEAINDLRTRIPEIEKIFDVHSRIGNGTFSTVLLGTLKKERDLTETQKRKFAIKHHIPTSHPERIMKELQCMAKIG